MKPSFQPAGDSARRELSIPFWLVGAVAERQALPGLPVVDAIIVICPLLAASILVSGPRMPARRGHLEPALV